MATAIYQTATTTLLRYDLGRPVGGSGVTSIDVLVVDLEDSAGNHGFGFSYQPGDQRQNHASHRVTSQVSRLGNDDFICGTPPSACGYLPSARRSIRQGALSATHGAVV